MRNRSVVDNLVEQALSELEFEFEGENYQDSPDPQSFYKWTVYTFNNGRWKKGQEQSPMKRMSPMGAYAYGQQFYARLAKTMNPLEERVAVQRCIMGDDGNWMVDVGHCREVEMLTGKGLACGSPRPPRQC
jgi:hypothetical protein